MGDFWELFWAIMLAIYGHFMVDCMGHFLRCSFTLFCGAFMDNFFTIFKAVLAQRALIWFPFSISNKGFLNSMHCKLQISVIGKLEKV